MRRLVLVAMMVGLAQGAWAADMPDLPLRGFVSDAPRPIGPNWEGFYAGGQGAYGQADMDFSGVTSDLAHQALWGTAMENEGNISSWPVLTKATGHSSAYGAFIGYNWQWEDAVIGLELNYLKGSFGGSSSGSMSRIFSTSNGYTNSITYDANASINIKHMGSVRARAAYSWNGLLPYIFGAAAFGVADMTKSVHIHGDQVNASAQPGFQNVPFDVAASQVQTNRMIVGVGGGTGMDVMLFNGVFVRGEYEYLRFVSPADTSVQTVRAGAGVKF